MKKLKIVFITWGLIAILALPAQAMRESVSGDTLWQCFFSSGGWDSATETLLLPASRKIAAPVWNALQQNAAADTLVLLVPQGDLDGAAAFSLKEDRGRYVYASRYQLAQRTQASLRAQLDMYGVPYRAFYIINALQVQADRETLLALALHPEVARIVANPRISASLPVQETGVRNPMAVQGVEWNISRIGAPEVWAMGYTGQGIVIAGQDTGYEWAHPALQSHYRGAQEETVNHNFNWHDAIHSGGGTCGADVAQPCDDYGHGTHTMGTMVGDDGGANQVGVAPDAQWMGCRNMNVGYGTPASYIECFEFFLAPYPVGETPADGHADPAMAPDIVNNSWSCPPSEGCDWQSLQDVAAVVNAAGIMVVSSASNYGPSCSSVREPIALYETVFSVGATDSGEAIASLSSRGPVTIDGSGRIKPDLVAPGISIRSSTRGGNYGNSSGTSMASPHVAGAVALLWSARPDLRGHITETAAILGTTAVPRYSTQCGDGADALPNNVFGWGRLDIAAAVDAALPKGFLTGKVENTLGVPLFNASIEITNTTGAGWRTSSDASGLFNFNVISGVYTVSANLPGYTPLILNNIHVTAQQTTTLPVTMTEICGNIAGAAFTSFPQEPWAETPVTLTGVITTGTLPVTYTWQIADPVVATGNPVTLLGNPAIYTFPVHTEPSSVYPVTMTAQNRCSQQIVTGQISVYNPFTPCDTIAGLSISYIPENPYPQTPIRFTATTLSGTLPITYMWNFADGNGWVEGNPVTHTFLFDGSGTFLIRRVRVIATNPCDQRQGFVDVTIQLHRLYLPVVLR
ncbi:MAG: S8 family serine peptidase [Anaerolineae bacterium]|nr:S8 family serine peptidase [Anaerolineae bacterium]